MSLKIRSEVFEHSIYPMQAKITSKNLVDLFKNLHLLSSFDYKISLQNWIESSSKYVNFTVTEAEMYFKTYQVLLKHVEEKRDWSMEEAKEED